MKKTALVCTLSLALLLSLTACHKPQAEQPDNSAATSTQADVSIPEPDNTPEPEPPKAPAPEQLSDTVPAAPAENEDPQDQSEPAAQEPAETEPVSEPVQPETSPVTAENPPAETTPTEQEEQQTQTQSTQSKQSTGGGVTLADLGITAEVAEEHNRQSLEAAQQKDWSQYVNSQGYHSTGEQMEKSWEGVIVK